MAEQAQGPLLLPLRAASSSGGGGGRWICAQRSSWRRGSEESRGGRLPCSLRHLHGQRHGPMAERGATAKLGNNDLDLLEPGPLTSSPASTSGLLPAFSFFGRILGGASMAARLAAGLATAGAPLSPIGGGSDDGAEHQRPHARWGRREGVAHAPYHAPFGVSGLGTGLSAGTPVPRCGVSVRYCLLQHAVPHSTQCDQPEPSLVLAAMHSLGSNRGSKSQASERPEQRKVTPLHSSVSRGPL
jgi:hypothetical protein